MLDKHGHRKIEVKCRDCDKRFLKREDCLIFWLGRCNKCAKIYRKENARGRVRRKEVVKCSICGLEWLKRKESLKKWKGFCRKCGDKNKYVSDFQKEQHRVRIIERLKKYGGRLPNPKPYPSKENHHNWKGGMPKCLNCGKILSSREVKRCQKCYHKKTTKEDHWNWKGGKTSDNIRIRQSPEYRGWRSSVFKRDFWTCVVCGYRSKRKGDIKADHIKPFFLFEKDRLDITNGRTLCLNCDYVYGYNHNRDKGKIVDMNAEIPQNISWSEIIKIGGG